MKKIIIIIICLISIDKIYSQGCTTNASDCENGNGISTNPSNPTNPNCANMLNNFDWRVQRTDLLPEDYIVYGPGTTYKEIQNPFTGPTGALHSGTVTNQRASNYQPEDGWELLKVEFGIQGNVNINNDPNFLPNQPTNYTKPKLPYMILYNKYSGTVRFFGSLLDANSDYETLEVILTIPTKDATYLPNNNPGGTPVKYNPNLKATNLLSIQGESVQPLDQETDEASISIFIKFRNNEAEFFWFDLPVAYDPCICNNKVQLDIAFKFVQTAQIALNQVVDDGIKNVNKPSSSGNSDYARMVFGRILAAGVSTGLAIASGGAVVNYKAYIDLVDVVKEHPSRNQTEKDNLNKLKNYLNCTEKLYSVISSNYKDVSDTIVKKQLAAAQKILEANTSFLSSLVKDCNDNATTAKSDALKFSGTFTRSPLIGGTEIFMAMPGSNWANTNLLPKDYVSNTTIVPSYPTYNERLGVISMLETPVVKLSQVFEEKYFDNGLGKYEKHIAKIELDENLKFAINPNYNVNISKSQFFCRYVGVNPNQYNLEYSSSENFEFGRYDGYFCDEIFNLNIKNSNSSIDLTSGTWLNGFLPQTSGFQLTTPFLPIDQFKNLTSVFSLKKIVNNGYFGHLNGSDYEKIIFVQMKVLLVSNNIGSDGKNIESIFYLTFPINVKLTNTNRVPLLSDFGGNCNNYKNHVNNVYKNSVLSNFKLPNSKIINKLDKFFHNDIIFNEDDVLFFDGKVTINSKLSTSNGKIVKIYSTIGFELEPGAEISPNIELIIGFPWEEAPQPPQTYAQVSEFCGNNNKYKAQTFSQSAIKREKEEYEIQEKAMKEYEEKQKQFLKVRLAPNPTTANFTVSIFNNNEQDYSITLMDVTGKVLFNNSYNGSQTSQFIETNGLAAGIYFVKITCGNTQKTEKLIIGSGY